MGQLCAKQNQNQDLEIQPYGYLFQVKYNNITILLTTYYPSESKAEGLVVDARANVNDSKRNLSITKPEKHQNLVYVTNAQNYTFKKIFHIYWQKQSNNSTSSIENSQPYLMVKQCIEKADSFCLRSLCFTYLYDNNSVYSKQQFAIIILLAIKYINFSDYPYISKIEINLKVFNYNKQEQYQLADYKHIFQILFIRNRLDNPSLEYNQIEFDSLSSNYPSRIKNSMTQKEMRISI